MTNDGRLIGTRRRECLDRVARRADLDHGRCVYLIGLNPAAFAGHSLRAGFLTSAAKRGASIFKMMDSSRHRSVDTLRGYIREADLFKDHTGAGLL